MGQGLESIKGLKEERVDMRLKSRSLPKLAQCFAIAQVLACESFCLLLGVQSAKCLLR